MFGTPATGETRSGRFVLPVEFPIESVDLYLNEPERGGRVRTDAVNCPAIPVGKGLGASIKMGISHWTRVAAAVGALATSWGRLNLYGNLIYFVVMFLSPVMAPMERLPLVLRWTSHILPTGQAALALTEAISGRFGRAFWLYTGLLALWLVAGTWLGMRKLDWRTG